LEEEMAYSVGDIRNIALIGHADVGKTTLAEAMLHKAGATNRLGSVDDGTAVTDYTAEERDRKISIDTSTAYCTWKGREFNIVDTPGYQDFLGQVVEALPAVETAVLLVSAVNGVQLNTLKTWNAARKAGCAGVVVINKMDGENIDLDAVIPAVQQVVGVSCVPFNLPIGQGTSFKGVFDVFSGGQAPEGVYGDPAEAHEAAIDAVIELNDSLMERYLEEGAVDQAELAKTLAQAVAEGKLVPMLFAAPRADKGIEPIMDLIGSITPSPASRPRKASKGGAEINVQPDADAPFAAFAFKAMTDPYVGKLSFLRVFRGALTGDSSVYNVRTQSRHRVGHIYRMQGREQKEIQKALPGDIIALAKIESIEVNDSVTAENEPLEFPKVVFPKPMVALAVRPKNRGDEQRIAGGLGKLTEEDKTFTAVRDTQTGELVITGMSTLHLDIMLQRLKNRFDVEVVTSEPKIPYKETITAKAEARYRHKKQTGGRGQYGEVFIRIEPLERGTGFEFVDEVVGGRVPNQYIPAVEKGVREQLAKGVISGNVVEDVRVALYDGSFHPVDSSEQAFKLAASKAFQEAFMSARPVLLEPVVNLEITIPSEFMGDITGDLNSRRGRITGMDQGPGGLQIIMATAPLSEVMRYATELRSITGGRGAYTMEFSHYDVVPQRIAESIIAQAKKEETEE
jgi:elongation factor G